MGFVTTCAIAEPWCHQQTEYSRGLFHINDGFPILYVSNLDEYHWQLFFGTDEEQKAWVSVLRRWQRKTKQRQTRKRHSQNGRTQGQLLQGINEQGDLGKSQQRFLSETKRSSWGRPQRAMVKEGWQVPAGLAQMQHRASQKKAVCLVPLLCEAFNQH